MKIAVIADTHGKFPGTVASRIAQADEIWHLGDFCDLSVLEAVRSVGPPVYAVLGNNDWNLDLPHRLLLERCGRTFLLIHIPPHLVGGADYLLHGHTHVPRDEVLGSTRVLNPGCVGRANRGAPSSFAWLEIGEGVPGIKWQLVVI